MIRATIASPDIHRTYIEYGPLHSFMQGVDTHLHQTYEFMVRPLLSCLGFSSEKALQHALNTNNTNHLKFPILLSCHLATISTGLRVFLSDPMVPDDVKDVSLTQSIAENFSIWFLGENGVQNLFSGKRLSKSHTSSNANIAIWITGLEFRGDKLWSTMLYNSLIVGTSIGLGKAAMRRNNSDARHIFSKTLLKAAVTTGCDKYTMIVFYEMIRDILLKGTEADGLADHVNVTSNENVHGKAQGPDERIEEASIFLSIL